MNAATVEIPDTTTFTTTQTANLPEPHVVVRGTGHNFLQKISAGDHEFQADEPINFGGNNTAPDPHDYLMASLGACTSMMVGLEARKKNWPCLVATFANPGPRLRRMPHRRGDD